MSGAPSSRSRPIFPNASVPSAFRKSRVMPTRNVSGMPALLLRWRDHTFLQNEAAIEATLTRGDHAVRTLRALVKRYALDPRQGPGLALSAIDFCLHLTVDWQSLGGRIHDLHPHCRMLDEAVQRQNRQNCADCPRGIDSIHPQQVSEHRLSRNRISGEIRVGDDEFIAVTHGPQRGQDVGVQEWI